LRNGCKQEDPAVAIKEGAPGRRANQKKATNLTPLRSTKVEDKFRVDLRSLTRQLFAASSNFQ
jgi:hypothetical protein